MITSDEIKDIRQSKLNWSAKLFYIWILVRYNKKRKLRYYELLEYGVSKRTVYRYCNELESHGYVNRKRSSAYGTIITII